MPSSDSASPGSRRARAIGDASAYARDCGIAVSISRAITRAVARPIGWVRSQVVERSMTPSCSPVTGSCTGAAQQTQLCTIGAKCSALNTIDGAFEPVGQVERVGADAGVVPAAAGHEVDGLGLAAHHPAAVRPEDAGLGVGDRDDQVAVLGGTPQLGLDPLDRGLERRVLPERPGVGLVGQRRLGDVAGDGRLGPLPGVEDLGADQRRWRRRRARRTRSRRGRRPAAGRGARRAVRSCLPPVCDAATVAGRGTPEQAGADVMIHRAPGEFRSGSIA